MAKIKSALELAMERTEGMVIDRKELKRKEWKEKGQRLASQALSEENFDLKASLSQLEKDEKEAVLKGTAGILISNIQFAANEMDQNRQQKVANAFSQTGLHTRETKVLMEQLAQLSEKKKEDTERLLQALEQQFAPVMEQKKKKMAQQSGMSMNMNAMDDPEFQKYYLQQKDRMDAQYGQILKQVKDDLSRLFGLIQGEPAGNE